MIKLKYSVQGLMAVVLSVIFVTASFLPAHAQVKKDSTKKIVLAKLDKKEETNIAVKAANVIYPDLLSGNEEQSLEYIEKFCTSKRAYLIRTYTKGKKFFPKAAAILKKHSVPNEYKVLLALESAFNGNAVSKAGAVGYWQIMDEVAQEYGLKYAPQISAAQKKQQLKLARTLAKKTNKKIKAVVIKDDRKNFNKSTYTAARYLKDRCRNLNNNYLLVAASYNCGVGNVWQAMKKTGKADPDFWDVKKYLPAETRSYVMNFIALNVIFNNYEKFASNTLSFKPVKIKGANADIKNTAELDQPTSLNY